MKLKEFTINSARPLPVILLLDTSGSMNGNKIESLNYAVKEMLKSFREESDIRAEVYFSIITFGGKAHLQNNPEPVSDYNFTDLIASGSTPMGEAFKILRNLIEDKSIITSRAYSPTIVLVSDGQPNDKWENELELIFNSERANKAMRLAMGIGEEADISMLKRFLNNPEQNVFEAKDSKDIKNFFKFVTMSVSKRTKSLNPNTIVIDPIEDIRNIKF